MISIHFVARNYLLLVGCGAVAVESVARGAAEVGGTDIGTVYVVADDGGPVGVVVVPGAAGVVAGTGALDAHFPDHDGVVGAHDFHDADNGTPGGIARGRDLLVADGSAVVLARLVGRG